MKYAIETLKIEKYRLIGLVRTIKANEHIAMSNIGDGKEEIQITEIDKAINILRNS